MIKQYFKKDGMGAVIIAFIGVFVLMVVFAIANPNFISGNNLSQMARSICPYLLVGIGQGIVCISGNIDLSIGSVLGMSSMISATLICNNVNPILALLVALVACLVAGFVNGILVGKYKLPSFIATLGTMTICRGVAQLVNGNYNTGDIGTAPLVEGIRDLFYYGKVGPIYCSVILCFVIWLIFDYVMDFTRTGRYIYAIGSNPESARLSGVNMVKSITIAYMISAFCSFVAGIYTMAASGMGSMQAGTGFEMYGVAAAVIGGISTLGGSGLLLGVIAGASVWAILQNGLTMANVPIATRNIIIGIIVIICVQLDIVRRGRAVQKKKDGLPKKAKIIIAAAVVVIAIIVAIFIPKDNNKTSAAGDGKVSAKIALITMDQTDVHWRTLEEKAQETIDKYNASGNNLELIWIAPETKNAAEQVEIIGTAIADNVDYIVISCVDKTSSERKLKEALDAGIKLIYIDSTGSVDASATYATDNYQGGVKAGQYMLKLLEERGLKDGTIGIIDVDPAMESVNLRYQGFADQFKGTDFELSERQFCNGDNAKAQELANTLINNGVIALYGTNDGCANGAGSAIKEARDNGSKVFGVGWDKSASNETHVKNGDLEAIMVQNPGKMGECAVEAVVRLEKGENLGGEFVDTGIDILKTSDLN